MAFGVYVHIPYCLQRCVYCDFATYESSQILPPTEYVARLKKEIRARGPAVGPTNPDTVYFGGGTPSLLEPELLAEILDALSDAGFAPKKEAELTLEINPATLTAVKLEKLVRAGFNRFSVGAQSFNDDLLKMARRKHSAQDTRDTLRLIQSYGQSGGLNFSMDLLFALPTQSLDQVERDLEEIVRWNPPHVSPYCLTVPEGHVFSKGRAPDEIQVAMFGAIEQKLTSAGLQRYEISNFAKPGFESRHNLLYWNDDEYWGVGLSSHSYLKKFEWGCRFWNPRGIDDYVRRIDAPGTKNWSLDSLDAADGERLQRHQALTDFFHTALRTEAGLDDETFRMKFRTPVSSVAGDRFQRLQNRGLLERGTSHWKLTAEGRLLSNQVFEELTFLGA